jgi:hypothetical protein
MCRWKVMAGRLGLMMLRVQGGLYKNGGRNLSGRRICISEKMDSCPLIQHKCFPWIIVSQITVGHITSLGITLNLVLPGADPEEGAGGAHHPSGGKCPFAEECHFQRTVHLSPYVKMPLGLWQCIQSDKDCQIRSSFIAQNQKFQKRKKLLFCYM